MATNIFPLANEANTFKELSTTDVNRVRAAAEELLFSIVVLFGIALAFLFFLFIVLPWLAVDSNSGQ